jgi:hypothetical protein
MNESAGAELKCSEERDQHRQKAPTRQRRTRLVKTVSIFGFHWLDLVG